MAQKTKKIIWHKKKGKLISASVLKPHGSAISSRAPTTNSSQAIQDSKDPKKIFGQKLSAQIKKAVRDAQNL